MLERIWGKGNTHPLLVGVETCIATVVISETVPQENENQSTLISSYTTGEKIHQGHVILPQRQLLNHVHYSYSLFIATRILK